MVEYSILNEGFYKKDHLNEEQIWEIFIKIFNFAESIKVASYKFGLISSIFKMFTSKSKSI